MPKSTRLCSIPDCGRRHYAKSWCVRHYDQSRAHDGDPLGFGRKITVHNQPARTCSDCQQFLPGAAFALNQGICRKCRRRFAKNNYSKGKTCQTCGTPIVNASKTGLCRKHHKPVQPTKRHINHHGYAILTGFYEHPNSQNGRGIILEHVKVMSDILGRPLLPHENVHHINGVRDDNRPENLELWSSSQPPGQRVKDKVAWAREIIALYG